MKKIFIIAMILICRVDACRADGLSDDSSGAGSVANSDDTSARANDPRLPPALPGEEMKVGGKKMKIWSTSGAVTTNQSPEPPSPPSPGTNNQNQIDPGKISVIVDQRKPAATPPTSPAQPGR